MLALISPAKTLDYETALPSDEYTQPRLLEHSQELIDVARKLSATEIASLMSVSEKIANLNVERFRDWQVEFDLANSTLRQKEAKVILKTELTTNAYWVCRTKN